MQAVNNPFFCKAIDVRSDVSGDIFPGFQNRGAPSYLSTFSLASLWTPKIHPRVQHLLGAGMTVRCTSFRS